MTFGGAAWGLGAVLRLQVPRNAPYKVLKAAWTDDDVMGKWEATSWAKKLAAKKKRANMGDFDRFKLMCALCCVNIPIGSMIKTRLLTRALGLSLKVRPIKTKYRGFLLAQCCSVIV